MSLISTKQTAHTVTTEYRITPDDILAWVARDLGVPPSSIAVKWEIDDGRDYDGNYEYAPRVNYIDIKVTNA